MKRRIKRDWIRALKSGEYKQGKERLRRAGRYCCLGVLCDLYAKERGIEADMRGLSEDGANELPSRAVLEWAGIYQYCEESYNLARANDAGESFDEIAKRIQVAL